MPAAPRSRASFSLIELLMAILIMSAVMGMLGSVAGLASIQSSQVKLAAEQLAAVLRQTRQLAMDHQSIFGVSFNITNAAGSSGQVLNNRDGGHWYRILGPHDFGSVSWSGSGSCRMPNFFTASIPWAPGPPPSPAGYSQLGPWLSSVQTDFYGPKYVLPPRQVRFISLTDEDNGSTWTPYSSFLPTYPRPWFGVFSRRAGDASPRLYAWGGYDAGFADNQGTLGVSWRGSSSRNPSGFYYQGSGPPIVGCVNPQDDLVINDRRGTGAVAQGPAPAPGGYQTLNILPKGQGRPLVNGDWLDCVLLFMPDGSCMRQDWMQMRHAFGQSDYSGPAYYFNLTTSHTIQLLGPGDMCNGSYTGWMNGTALPYNNLFEATDYDNVTGMYYITLGPDAADDRVDFPSAASALASMMPMYRVGVSRQGEVQIIKVSADMPLGTALDPKWQTRIWTTGGVGTNGYWNNTALSAAGEPLEPAETFVTPAMMSNMQWWVDP